MTLDSAPRSAEATADLCDRLGASALVCSLLLHQFGGLGRFAGHARTVSVSGDNHLVRQLLSEEGRGDVLAVDGGGRLDCALFGDNLAALAIQNGWVGVLVNGAVRDTATLSQLPIGIAALGKNPRPPAKIGKGEIDVPVTFGDITIEPGDFIVCDEDGVVVLPGGQTG